VSLFDRVRATGGALLSPAANPQQRLPQRGGSLMDVAGSSAVGKALGVRGKVINQVGDAQNALIERALGAVNADSLLGKAANDVAERFGFTRTRKKPTLPSAGQRANWAPAPHWGGLKADAFYSLFAESAQTPKAWKNLWFVSVEELRPSQASPTPLGGLWNMLATDVSFAPTTMPGEAVPIGGANMDTLATTERVELRLTTMDTADGRLKRWFLAKADQVAHRDGTFGLPADYLVIIRVTHMAPTNLGSDEERFRHAFLMRPANIEHELSRTETALELLPMSFVQFDTFLEVP
jgi:hypothetical protein